MKESTVQRWRFVALPYLAVAGGCMAGYTLLTWLLFRVLNLEEPGTGFWSISLLMFLPAIPLYWWVLPRARLLFNPPPNGSLAVIILMPAIFIGLGATMIAKYAWEATQVTAHIDRPAQVLELPDADRFLIARHAVDKRAGAAKIRVGVSGKHNQNLDFDDFLAAPLIDPYQDGQTSRVWVAVHCSSTISNRLDHPEKTKRYNKFATECAQDFLTRQFEKVEYFKRVLPGDELAEFQEAARRAGVASPTRLTFIAPSDEPPGAIDRTNLWFGLGISMAGIFFMLGIAFLQPLRNVMDPPVTSNDSRRQIRRSVSMLFSRDLAATKVLSALLVLVFLVSANGSNPIYIQPERLISLGANATWLTRDGEWWRLITAITLHGGLNHLIMNGVGLLMLGIVLEARIGAILFATAFLVTGFAGGIATLAFNDHAVSVGASGAVFGLVGMLLPLAIRSAPGSADRTIFRITFIWYGLAGLAISFIGLIANVDNAAHVGGLLAGIIIGTLVRLPTERKDIPSV